MIRLLVHLGTWLDKRFPEKRVVSLQDWESLQGCKALIPQVETLVSRLSVVESAAVHKDAVQTLIVHVQQLKDEVASLKAGLGMNRIGDSQIRAMLNGEPVIQGDNE